VAVALLKFCAQQARARFQNPPEVGFETPSKLACQPERAQKLGQVIQIEVCYRLRYQFAGTQIAYFAEAGSVRIGQVPGIDLLFFADILVGLAVDAKVEGVADLLVLKVAQLQCAVNRHILAHAANRDRTRELTQHKFILAGVHKIHEILWTPICFEFELVFSSRPCSVDELVLTRHHFMNHKTFFGHTFFRGVKNRAEYRSYFIDHATEA